MSEHGCAVARGLWHPVAAAADLGAIGARPLAVRVLGEAVALWRDETGAVRAFADRCPHRGASLALGCVREGRLECAYHGWRFEGGGRVVAIPALPGFEPPPTHRASAHEAVERHGLVWVRLQPGDGDVPAFVPEADDRLRKLTAGPYDVQASAPRVVENFLDLAHFGFVHDGWLGARGHDAVPAYRVQPTPTGFVASGCRAWQPRASLHSTSGAMVEYAYELTAPYCAVLTKVPEAGSTAIESLSEAIGLFVLPTTEDASRVWFRLATTDFETPAERLLAFQDTIFGQDRPILESQLPKRLPISDGAPVAELSSAADRSAAAYRRFLRDRGVRYGTC